jgi:Putative Ig domain
MCGALPYAQTPSHQAEQAQHKETGAWKMEDRRLTQNSQSGRGGRAASLVVVALVLIMLIATSSAGAAIKPSPLRLGPLQSQQVHADQPFRAQLSAKGGLPPYTYELVAGDVPGPLTVTASGELVGDPTLAGSFPLKVLVRDSYGTAAIRTYTLEVALTVPSVVIQTWVGGDAYIPLEAFGSQGVGTFKVAGKDVPPGVYLLEEGGLEVLAGSPTKAGLYEIPVAATDRTSGAKGKGSVTIHVWGSNIPIALHSFRELNGPSFAGSSFAPESEANGVISGSTTVIEGGRFTYDTHSELLHIFPADGEGTEYLMICEPARAKCSGPSPHGEAFLTE